MRYVRISPRKVRPVIPLVKGKGPEEAIAILFSVKKKASQYLIDLIKSAVANAKRMQGIDVSSLCVSNIIASGGPQMKRFRAASMGRASQIRKRTSHITVELDYLAARAGRPEASAPAKTEQAAPGKQKADVKAPKGGSASAAEKKQKTKEPAKPESGKKGKE